MNAAKDKISEVREQYDQLLADDKALERNFKRDFSDCEPFVDQLYKLFKRRPRYKLMLFHHCQCSYITVCCFRGQKVKQGTGEGLTILDPKSQNPFPHRPPTAVGGGGQKLSVRGSEDALSELDHVSHMPDGVDVTQWDRLVTARRRKWDSEMKVGHFTYNLCTYMLCFYDCWLQVKAVALQLADMESFLKRREVEEDRIQSDIQDAFSELNR